MTDPLDRLTMTVAEAAQALGISRAAAYKLANTGDLPVVRLSRRLVVPTIKLREMLGMSAEAETPKPAPVIVQYVWSDGVTTTTPKR